MGKSEIELKIEKLSDDELIEMLENKLDYTEEAIQVAEKVMSERGHRKLLKKLEEKQLAEEKAERDAAVEKVQENTNRDSLSKKVNTLLFLKGLLYFSIILVTAIFIDTFLDMMEMIDNIKKLDKSFSDDDILGEFLKGSGVWYIVHLIVLFSLTKIIEFIFDLKRKTDK